MHQIFCNFKSLKLNDLYFKANYNVLCVHANDAVIYEQLGCTNYTIHWNHLTTMGELMK